MDGIHFDGLCNPRPESIAGIVCQEDVDCLLINIEFFIFSVAFGSLGWIDSSLFDSGEVIEIVDEFLIACSLLITKLFQI